MGPPTAETTFVEELRRVRAKHARVLSEIRHLQRAADYRSKVDKARVRGELGPCEQCGRKAIVLVAASRMRRVHRWCMRHADEHYAHRLAAQAAARESRTPA